jgi:hypothetical protein
MGGRIRGGWEEGRHNLIACSLIPSELRIRDAMRMKIRMRIRIRIQDQG